MPQVIFLIVPVEGPCIVLSKMELSLAVHLAFHWKLIKLYGQLDFSCVSLEVVHQANFSPSSAQIKQKNIWAFKLLMLSPPFPETEGDTHNQVNFYTF